MRFLLYMLGKALSERIIPIIGSDAAVNCPSIDRLSMANPDNDDIILMNSLSAERNTIRKIIGEGAKVIIFFSDMEKLEKYKGNAIPLINSFTEKEFLSAVNQLSKIDNIDNALKCSLAGSSEIMRRTREKIKFAINSDLPVNIEGETGTGKTLAAILIHKLSGIKNQLVTESCGCLDTAIADSELFGHEKGAFSGALENRDGLLAEANGSILFLDDIQDLPLNLQTKLLRVIETGKYRKLGSNKELMTSFRLITASNISLDNLFSEKRIRNDFFQRIHGIDIRMPSLSEHLEDIPEILEVLMKREKKYRNREFLDISIFTHSFSGNVRELFREAELYMQGIRH